MSSTDLAIDSIALQAGLSGQAGTAQGVPSGERPKSENNWKRRLHLSARPSSFEVLGSRRAEVGLTLDWPLEAYPPYVPLATEPADRASSRRTPYRPLQESNEIRLVTIESSKNARGLSCKIEHCSINSYYTAVSYTWGQLRYRHKVVCNSMPLWITANCYALLRALQASKTNGPFWIDALCIDQQNVEERNHQVAQMGNIYNNASMTIVYLGDHTRASIRLQQSLQRNEALKEDLVPFFSRPWFSRTWVVQEMLLSRNVVFLVEVHLHHHQHLILPIEKLLKLISDSAELSQLDIPLLAAQKRLRDGSRADEFARILRNPTQETISLITPWHQVGARESRRILQGDMGFFTSEKTGRLTLPLSRLVEILDVTRNLQCQDPRDKVFAIQSLLTQPIPEIIAVDYSRDLGNVYADLTWFCIDYELPEVLQTCGRPREFSSLPSWVIDWRRKPECPPLMSRSSFSDHSSDTFYPPWSAGWQSGRKQTIAKRSGSTAVIRGVLGGVVSYVTTVSQLDDRAGMPTTQDFDNQAKRWKRELEYEMLPDDIALQLHANRAGLGCGRTSPDWMFKKDISEERWAAFKGCARLWELDKGLERCVNRRPIILNDGSLGLAPSSTRIGDMICVFLGFPTPFVLRRTDAKMRLVGQCLVMGMMEGEKVRDVAWETARQHVPRSPLRDFEIW